MRYTVKLLKWGEIRNVIHTDKLEKALEIESYLIKCYGKDNVWVADSIQEILVG
jgi:hypothetical protein